MSDLAATLRRVPLFSDLSDAEFQAIAERVTVRRFDAGAIVFAEGDACHELLIVQVGVVKLLKTAANGRQQLVSIERPGNSLSEAPVFDGSRYPATALGLEAEHFRAICRRHPEVALKVIQVLGHRLRKMSKLVEDLSFATVRGRLLAHLIGLAEERGRLSESGIEFDLTENNEELAARLGTVRELISRNLGRLHGEGWVDIRRRTVTVPDLAALKEELNR